MLARDLDGREYKLLLDPRNFGEGFDLESANVFWHSVVVPVFARLGDRPSGKPRGNSGFGRLVRRSVCFRDTAD